MNLQTNLKLFAREHIENWKYVDTIIFLIILLIYMGYTDPCDRCAVNLGTGQMSCKEAFLQKIDMQETDYGFIIPRQVNLNFTNISVDP